MTVRRKPDPQDPANDTFSIKLDKGTVNWRVLLLVVVLSGTPYGQQLLSLAGVPVPKASPISVSNEIKELQEHTHTIEQQVAEVRTDVAAVKQDVKLVKNQITAFEVNFERFKAKPTETP